MFVVLSSVYILNIQLSLLSFVIFICSINIDEININENLINKLLWNVIDTSHSINWINKSCWLFEYIINICYFLVGIGEFLWINIVIILIVISIMLMELYQIIIYNLLLFLMFLLI